MSVIVPTFNRASCLARALESVLAQTYTDLEVIVVDDGSTDETPELVAGSYGGFSPLRYIYQPNRGVAAARNTGLRASRGDFVGFLDSDDIWRPWKLELQLDCMRRAPEIGMIWSDMEAVDPAGTVINTRYLSTMYRNYRRFPKHTLFPVHYELPVRRFRDHRAWPDGKLHIGDIFSPMVAGNLVHTSTVLMRRRCLDRVGEFNTAFRAGEDYDFHLRTCREGPVGLIDLPTISYQIGMPDQLGRQSQLMARAFLAVLTETLTRERDRIALSQEMIAEVLAEANAWLAEALVAGGEPVRAVSYFGRSLRYRPWQLRPFVQMALCCMPSGIAEAIRGAYRNCRRFAEAG